MPDWIKFLLVLALSAVVVVCEESTTEELPKDVAEGRARRKRFYKFLFQAISPMISSLSYILLIKAKVVVVGLFLVGIYFFGHKLWPGGLCGHSIVSDVPPPYLSDYSGITGYHATGPDIVSSYPGPEPYPISGSYLPPSAASSPSIIPSISSISSSSSGGPPAAKYGSRRGRRDLDNQNDEEPLDNEIYWTDQLTEMGFLFLGVKARACRKRFVCEFDFHARSNPILLFATRAMGRDIFHNYRDPSDERARYYQDCGRIYAECAVPKRKPSHYTRRRRPLPATTSTTEAPNTAAEEEVEEPEESSASVEVEDESVNEISMAEKSRRNQRNDWRPITSQPLPLGKQILRRSWAQTERVAEAGN
ncbi:uncharacterized protein LOC128736725 [Sabethes cyaneus]|uniref:uncharacterized protein LOC128736725 n=1 Tax=Sabethes cyaneus TaxID=53552 RepID=UPI00237DB801|nr:uncharacterized protein LOC128736725 [Sabethes cyaneus]